MHLLPFLLRAQAYLLISIFAFLAGKSHPTLLRGLTRKYWVPNFRHFVTIHLTLPPPLYPYLPLFVTIRRYSRIFVNIRDYSPLLVLFAIRDCSLFAIRYSPFAIRYSPFAIRVFQTPGIKVKYNRSSLWTSPSSVLVTGVLLKASQMVLIFVT